MLHAYVFMLFDALFHHLTFPSFNIRCFSIKVISQAKGALCSANILVLGEQWMVIDELKYTFKVAMQLCLYTHITPLNSWCTTICIIS